MDFITFSEPGRFREQFLDLVFQSGEFAIDHVVDGLVTYPDYMGPGSDLLWPIDDDMAPYPNPSGSRKRSATGATDLRYWVQFAGGAWSSLNVRVNPQARYRASSSPPPGVPATILLWCPDTRPCMSWARAVKRREVRCFRYGLNGSERPVGAETCFWHHPRMHWRVVPCDDCPLPAGENGAAFYREDE